MTSTQHGLVGDAVDPVSSGLITMADAEGLVELFKTEMYSLYPMVYLKPTCGAEELRRTRPTLFLAVLAAAAGKEYPAIAVELDKRILQQYADRVVMGSEKSLELVQCLLVSSTWYQPPTKLNQFKYTEYVHLAGHMAIDIGIGSRPLDDGEGAWTAHIESMRTFAAVLAKAAGVAMTGRKASAIRLGSWGRECLDRLEECLHPESVPGDRILAAWARLLYITDSVAAAFNYDDPGAAASICDVKTQLMMNEFAQRLITWRNSCPDLDRFPTLQLQYHAARAYLREAVLYVDHRPEDFKVPYRMSSMLPHSTGTEQQSLPVEAAADSLMDLMQSAHALLESFLSIEAGLTRALPLGMFVRVSYACFILAKLCISAGSAQSRLSHLIDGAGLQAEIYLNRVLLHVRNAIGPNGSRLPAIFLNLLTQMREWCVHPELVHDIGTSPGTNAGSGGETAHTSPREEGSSFLSSPTPSGAPMTGTFDSNFERFGNAEAVDSAARHGTVHRDVDIQETVTRVKSALLGRIEKRTEVPEAGSGIETGPGEYDYYNQHKQPPDLGSEYMGLDDHAYLAQMQHMHFHGGGTAMELLDLPILDPVHWLDDENS